MLRRVKILGFGLLAAALCARQWPLIDVADVLTLYASWFVVMITIMMSLLAFFYIGKTGDGSACEILFFLTLCCVLSASIAPFIFTVPRPFSPAYGHSGNMQMEFHLQIDRFRFDCGGSESVLNGFSGSAFGRSEGGRKSGLDGLYGSVFPHELTWIMGESGSGKSTLVKLMTGRLQNGCLYGTFAVNSMVFENATASSVAAQMEFLQRSLGIAPQDKADSITKDFSVRQNLEYAALWKRPLAPESIRKEHITRLLKRLKLDGHQDKASRDTDHGGQLSGGQGERVGLAMALVGDRPALFADEPTAGQGSDATIARALRDTADEGKAVVVVAHRLSDASFALGDVLLLLSGSRDEEMDDAAMGGDEECDNLEKPCSAPLPSGVVLYWGTASLAEAYFEKMGITRNPGEPLYELFMKVSTCAAPLPYNSCARAHRDAAKHEWPRNVTFGDDMRRRPQEHPPASKIDGQISSRDLVVEFVFQVLVELLRSLHLLALDFAWAGTLVMAVVLAGAWLRSIQSESPMEVASGLYLLNLLTFLIPGYIPVSNVAKEASSFFGRDVPEGFGKGAFKTGKILAVFWGMQLLSVLHAGFLELIWRSGYFKRPCSDHVGFGTYLRHWMVAYGYTTIINITVAFRITDITKAFCMCMAIHVLAGAFFAGFFPDHMRLVEKVQGFSRWLLEISPPYYMMRFLLNEEWNDPALWMKSEQVQRLGVDATEAQKKAVAEAAKAALVKKYGLQNRDMQSDHWHIVLVVSILCMANYLDCVLMWCGCVY